MNQAHALALPIALGLLPVALPGCGASGGGDEASDSPPASPGPITVGWQAPGTFGWQAPRSDPQAPRPDPQAPRSDPQAPAGSGADPGGGDAPVDCSAVCSPVPARCVADCQQNCREVASASSIGCGDQARALLLCASFAGFTCNEEGEVDTVADACDRAGRDLYECVRAATPPRPDDGVTSSRPDGGVPEAGAVTSPNASG